MALSVQYCVVPKYRYRILKGAIKEEVEYSLRLFSTELKCKIIEMNVQEDYVHLLIMVSPSKSISEIVGTLKGRAAIRILSKFPNLKTKLYWGNHFWARGYCVDTVGLDAEMIRKYVKYQEKKEKHQSK